VAKFFHPADEPGIHAACSCGVFIGTPQSKGIDGWHGATATSTEAAPTAQPIHAGRCKPSKIRDVDFATKPGHIECVLDLIARWIGARSDPLMTTKTTTRPPNRPALRHPLDSEEAARAIGAAAGKSRSSLTSRSIRASKKRRDERSWKIGSNGLLVWAHHALESAKQNRSKNSAPKL
jgi:hypothetical protein